MVDRNPYYKRTVFNKGRVPVEFISYFMFFIVKAYNYKPLYIHISMYIKGHKISEATFLGYNPPQNQTIFLRVSAPAMGQIKNINALYYITYPLINIKMCIFFSFDLF